MTDTQPNIDPEEIAKFEALADEWWDPAGKMKPLHELNPLRLEYIQQQTTLKNKAVIDVGCGGGILTESLARMGANATGIDMSESVLNVARAHATLSELTIQYQHTAIEEFSKKHNNKFNIVTCMELLEHVPDPTSIIHACAELVKPGGLIFFSTINRTLKAFGGAIIAAEYILNWLPKGTHHYSKFIKPSELTAWATRENLQMKSLQGVEYSPISRQYSLNKNVDINYMICLQKREQNHA